MKWVILSLLNIVVYVPGLLLRYIPFTKVYRKKEKQVLFLTQGIMLIVNAAFFFVAGTHGYIGSNFGELSLLLFGAMTAGVNILLVRNRWRELLFTCGFSLLVGQCLQMTVLFVMYYTCGVDSVEDYFVGMLLFLFLFAVSFPIWKKILLKSVTPFLTLDSGHYWNTIWFIPIAMFMTCYVTGPIGKYAQTTQQLIGHYFILCAAIFVCLSIAKVPAGMMVRLEMERRLSAQEEHYTQLAAQVEKARKSRHDFKHHIMAIRDYIKKDDKEGLALYCDQLLERNTGETVIPYTGNSAVDGVIYHYALLAKEHRIRFDYPAVCRNPGIENMDFCVLLGNALDNAIAGCQTLEADRYITIVADTDSLSTRLMITNSFDGIIREEDGKVLSRKRDNRPGVGIESMRNICEKYNAAMDIRYDEKTFSVLFVFTVVSE